METRFSVATADVDAAIVWLGKRGFAPCRVEQDDGDAVLVFPPLPGDRLGALAMALPLHLSSKVGIVVGDGPPFLAGR